MTTNQRQIKITKNHQTATIERNTNSNSISFQISKLSGLGSTKVTIFKQPTANCQSTSIAGIQNLCYYPQFLPTILKEIIIAYSKRQIILDYQENWENEITKLLEKSGIFILKKKYTNLTNSQMILALYRIDPHLYPDPV